MFAGMIVYKQTAALRRLQRDSVDADIEGYVTIENNLKVNIQPASAEYAALLGDGAMGRIFRAFTSYPGVQIGMEIVSSGTATVSGMRYSVIGMEPWTGPLGTHYELMLRLNVR